MSAHTEKTTHNYKNISLEEFKALPISRDVAKILDRFNGGTFMECHVAFYRETGLWIEELVPVFQKLDAALILRPVPTQRIA